ncbi:MAG: oligopeptide transporter, OPT family [Deltaproteobacteria bacterium]|nr:oligopeptide transporter, OPT family [Deltaproteobacteria bacterium]
MSAHETPKGQSKLLPENAYRKLQPGEVYRPIVPPEDGRREVSLWSIGLGVAMVVVFTAAAAYISLRAGSGIEAAIPIAILAIFFGMLRKTRSTILENVMVQSVGQASGVVAAGATFVVPALYINQLAVSWWQIFLACTAGGVLGVVLIIPLRKYFVRDLHGELPFPEATAINEVIVTGESASGGAGKILILAFLMGAAYDFLIEGVHLWNSNLTTDVLPFGIGDTLSGLRIEVQLFGIAALFGLGYIIGMKYAAIIAGGSVLAYVVMVPLVYQIGKDAGDFAYAGGVFNLSTMSAGAIFSAFIKPIGIGAIAVSGIIGILRMWKIVVGSVSLGFKGLSREGRAAPRAERTQLDMNPRNVLLIQLAAALGMGIFFFLVASITRDASGAAYSTGDALLFALVGMVAGFLLSFLFTPVAAQAIAIVGVNPVSGMTLITVVLAIGTLILVGLKGEAGMIIALIVGTAVCTALSTSGALISDFKVGYWIGSTPRNQQVWKFLGVVVAALVVALVIPLMDSAYQFLISDPASGLMVPNDKVLPAPQGNMIAAVSRGLMSNPEGQPWLLYGLGGLVSVLLLMAGVPMLAFALGMYLPIGINMAVLAGAACAWVVSRTGGTEEIRQARASQGALIASGLMAGAALFGILTAVLRLPTVGAPIQYLSVGEEYRVETVVDGQTVRDREGAFLGSCDAVQSTCGTEGACNVLFKEGQKCNELLNPVTFQEDAKGRPVYDAGAVRDIQARASSILRGIGSLDAADPAAREAAAAAAEATVTLAGGLVTDDRPDYPVVGARGLLKAVSGLRRGVLLAHQQAFSTHQDAQKAAQDTRRAAAARGTDEARAQAEAAVAEAEVAAKALDKALAERNAVLGAITDARAIHGALHPEHRHPGYEGATGRGIGFLMLFVLSLGCYLLARKGAEWELTKKG